MFLTQQQIQELTGYRRKCEQVRWLRKNGIRHYVRADGHPTVPANALEAPRQKVRAEPNLEAVQRAS